MLYLKDKPLSLKSLLTTMQELLAMISTVASSTGLSCMIFRRMLHFIGTNKLFSVVSKNQQSAELGVTLDSHDGSETWFRRKTLNRTRL